MPLPGDNLFDPGVWRPALEKYAAVTRLMVHVYDADGRLVEPWAAANPLAALFEEHGYDAGLFAECARDCLTARDFGAGRYRQPIVLEGGYGLAVVGTGLVLDGRLVGAAVAGYVLVDFTQVYGMQRLAAESGVSFERLWNVARLLPPVPKDRLMLHGELLQALGDALLRENRRTRASQQSVTDLKLAAAAKDEFLAVLSHELRNPLASLSTALEITEMTTDPKSMARSRAVMRRQVGHLTRLVDDLLQVSRITQGKLGLQKSRIELAALVESAVEDTLDVVEERDHELLVNVPEEPIFLDADAMRLGQVFANLLSNAARYTPNGGRIEISAERVELEVRVTIRDNGLGIPADKLDSLFEMFMQLDQSPERGYRGLGIGLSLAKSLVELHGGRIEARSVGLGKGSEFNVWLPLASESDAYVSPTKAESGGEAVRRDEAPLGGARAACDPAAGSLGARAAAKGGAAAGIATVGASETLRHRVLVIEDNKDAAQMLAALLEILGHETRIAYDGLEGVKAAAEFQPQLVLLDIGLPRLGGYDVARRIRGEPCGENVTLVAVTGWGQESDRRLAAEAGFDRHLTKPVKLEALRALLEDVSAAEAAARRT
jgi:signal transduction histidine kinase/CheY-like chemotaxis protein